MAVPVGLCVGGRRARGRARGTAHGARSKTSGHNADNARERGVVNNQVIKSPHRNDPPCGAAQTRSEARLGRPRASHSGSLAGLEPMHFIHLLPLQAPMSIRTRTLPSSLLRRPEREATATVRRVHIAECASLHAIMYEPSKPPARMGLWVVSMQSRREPLESRRAQPQRAERRGATAFSSQVASPLAQTS